LTDVISSFVTNVHKYRSVGVCEDVNLFARKVASALLAGVLLTVLGSSCASPAGKQRAVMLALPYKEFDQTFGSGWRALYDDGKYFEAGGAIETYLRSRPELTVGQINFLHFHAGQLFALAGQNRRALEHLD
jgi:hypothetical protein